MWKDVSEQEKFTVDIEENTIQMMYVISHFLWRIVKYINFSHILYRCGLKIFHDLHAMVLYYREGRVMTVQECVVDQLLIM